MKLNEVWSLLGSPGSKKFDLKTITGADEEVFYSVLKDNKLALVLNDKYVNLLLTYSQEDGLFPFARKLVKAKVKREFQDSLDIDTIHSKIETLIYDPKDKLIFVKIKTKIIATRRDDSPNKMNSEMLNYVFYVSTNNRTMKHIHESEALKKFKSHDCVDLRKMYKLSGNDMQHFTE